MVVFVCDGCCETLKKNKVDEHANRCRKCISVSCVDCSVSFFADDYRLHTSCVSEAERYEKTVYKGNKKSAKKNPQEAWTHLIAEASECAPPALKHYMQRLAELDNVPRKEKPFRNWAANSLNLRGQQTAIVASLWQYLSELREREQNQRKEIEEEEKREKIVSLEVKCFEEGAKTEGHISTPEPTTHVQTELSSKAIRKTIKVVLKKAPKRSMKIKDLRTAVQDHLCIKKNMKKMLKAMVSKEIQADGEKIIIDGKVVTLK